MRVILRKFSQFILILVIFFGWVFSGWPQIWHNPPFPPKVEQARAAAPAGVIVGWPGTEASIPSGWSRLTDFDGFFLKSVPNNSTNPGTATSTATTHTHTSPTHNHTQDAHSHTGNAASGAPSATVNKHTAGGDSLLSTDTHTHTVPNSSSDTATNQTTAATLSSTSNDPPFSEVIWIQSNGTTDIPDTAIAFFNSASLPTGWDAVSPGKFFKGAVAASDPGVDGGADSHTHTSSHNHTQDAHGHTSASSGTDTPGNDQGTSNPANSATAHAHSITWATTVATNQAADGNVATVTYLPPYYALVGVQNTSGSPDLPDNIIAVWRGSLADIPANWVLADGTNDTPNLLDRFVMSTSTANLGNTGGSQGHSHTATAHTHTQDSHTHALTLEDPSLTAQKRTNQNGGPGGSNAAHTHSATSAGATATNQDATITVDNTSDTRPPFVEVAFIQYQPAPSLTLIVSTDNFPDITPGTAVFATTTLSVDSSGGWNITLSGDDQSPTDTVCDLDDDASIGLTDQLEWIPGAATTTAGNAVRISSLDNSADVLAFRVMTASGTASFISTAWWGTTDSYIDSATTLWAGIASSTASDKRIGESSVNSGGGAVLSTILYYLDVPATQLTGDYRCPLTYTAVAL